jgi:hypothetical protein
LEHDPEVYGARIDAPLWSHFRGARRAVIFRDRVQRR